MVDHNGDKVVENAGEGTDTVQASLNWTLGAHVENLELTGSDDLSGTGNDMANVLTGNDGANTLSGMDGDDTLNGGAGNDELDGGLGADILNGGLGDDRLDGCAGMDALTGGLGDDTYVVDDLGDTVNELADEGTDTVESSISWTLGSNVENLTLTGAGNIDGTGTSADETLIGNDGDNVLTGNGGKDTLRGGDGNDTLNGGDQFDALYGGADNDTLNGGDGGDHVQGDAGNDTLNGEGGNDWMLGGDGNDIINGGDGRDRMFGHDGDDTLYGGAGEDTMAGGAGSDTFVYAAMSDARDTITDFETGALGDSLDLAQLMINIGYGGSDAFTDGYLQLTQSGADTLVQVDVDGGANSLQTLVTLQNTNSGDVDTGIWVV
ncbi:MAG: calcium-binding protein [Alphaproteobacteria bacterium]